VGGSSVGEGFLAAFRSDDKERLEEFYSEHAVLYTPLTGRLRGRDAIAGHFGELHSAFPGMRITLHDEFGSPADGRACIRLHLDWHNQGPFRGHPPTGRSGEMAELHSFRLNGGRVAEQVAGISGFQLPRLFLADWRLGFPREADDPAPTICSAAPGDPPSTGAGASLARRFTDAFGRRDTTALNDLYADDVALYTPLAWPVRGRDALTAFAQEFHTANPGLRIALHDEFYSADGTRACWRIRLHYHNIGPFYGNSPTGEAGVMTETHAVRIADGQITEQVVGDNSFHMPHQELVAWQMPFPEHTPDPAPPITSVTAPGEAARQ
jgi:ketosteroid isomerase-like protein